MTALALILLAATLQSPIDETGIKGGREPGGNAGQTCVNRFHILDRIPFAKDFRFEMELWNLADCRVNLSVIDYWYGAPGATEVIENQKN